MNIKVGCCGFPGGMKKYFEEFNLVEVQKTFYKPPRLNTLEKWRKNAPHDFEFAVKAWQLITHPASSPTYKKAGIEISEKHKDKYGFFKPTNEVFEAWETTKNVCEILKSKICIMQTPAKFKPSEENLKNMTEFFNSIDRGNIVIGWEPRGKDWTPDIVKEICEKLNLIHVIDPFAQDPQHFVENIAYFRLHGAPPGKKMYRYKYSTKDFEYLFSKAKTLPVEKVYILFNNLYMGEDAKKFKDFLKKESQVNNTFS